MLLGQREGHRPCSLPSRLLVKLQRRTWRAAEASVSHPQHNSPQTTSTTAPCDTSCSHGPHFLLFLWPANIHRSSRGPLLALYRCGVSR